MENDSTATESIPHTSSGARVYPQHRPHSKNGSRQLRIGPNDSLAQMAFAPATKTTVVTTTTTTTVELPPFRVPGPKQGYLLDPKHYPLLHSPTPASLKNISFHLAGETLSFTEAEDATVALKQTQKVQKRLEESGGSLQTVENHNAWIDDGPAHATISSMHLERNRGPRPASPESIADYEDDLEEAGPSHHPKRRRIAPSDTALGKRPAHQTHSRLRGAYNNPITPESQLRSRTASRRSERNAMRDVQNTGVVLPSTSSEQRSKFTLLSPGMIKREDDEFAAEPDLGRDMDSMPSLNVIRRGVSHDTTVPTPPIESDEGRRPLSRRTLSSIPARLHVAESPSAQDGSLPSPSLSPVTAAANLQNTGYFADIDSNSEYASQPDCTAAGSFLRQPTPTKVSFNRTGLSREGLRSNEDGLAPDFSNLSLTQIPALLDYFEAVPDELKGYLMHQLLRRCPKPTLQIVADVVNPALKCDFLSVLPPELGLAIVRFLDIKSLCKAAQVSKKWRQMINGDEEVWKGFFEADGFTIPEGEMEQAIIQGWGWQDPHGVNGYEKNIGTGNVAIKSEAEANSPSPSLSQYPSSTGPLRRSKRKAATALSTQIRRSKRQRTSPSSRETSIDTSAIDWQDHMGTAQGPFNTADAAMHAVPHPDVGLPNLGGLHLYKSLYRRHYLIRRNWMYEDTKPRHLAFRAHDTHVVTCLQFDTDKILTGSDDNNINVYDTKTGALKAKLFGHEGGVWALQYEGNILVSGSTDRSVRVWNIAKGEERQVFRGHTSTVRCLQIVSPVKIGENTEGKPIMMPRQPLIITGSRDSTLRVWKLPKPDDQKFIQAETENDADDCPWFLRTLTGHQHSVRAIAAHGDTLVSGSYDCTVRVWKISTGDCTLTLRGHAQKVYSVVLDHVRNRCISGSMDNMVRIWDLDTGALRYSLEGHSSLVGLLDLNCDRLVSAAADSTLRIWDPENGSCKATLTAHTGAITCFQHDGQKVISGSDRTLKLWNIKTGECIKDLLSDLSGVWQVKFNERRCVAAVQREGLTYIEVLDFGAARDGVPEEKRGHRIVVDSNGSEVNSDEDKFDLDESNDG